MRGRRGDNFHQVFLMLVWLWIIYAIVVFLVVLNG